MTAMTELMNAVILTGFGGPEKLVYTQVQKPIPKENEVLIKVGACSVNNTDINTRTGWYAAQDDYSEILPDRKQNNLDNSSCWTKHGTEFPRIQGADIVGQVVEIGENKLALERYVQQGFTGEAINCYLQEARLEKSEYQHLWEKHQQIDLSYQRLPPELRSVLMKECQELV